MKCVLLLRRGGARHIARKDIDMLQASARDMGWQVRAVSVAGYAWCDAASNGLSLYRRGLRLSPLRMVSGHRLSASSWTMPLEVF